MKEKLFQFKDLEDFKKNSNNFFLFFTEKSWVGKIYRQTKVFERLVVKEPELVNELTNAIDGILKEQPHTFSPILPWKKLYEAYNIMCELVQETDPNVMINNKIDSRYLCR